MALLFPSISTTADAFLWISSTYNSSCLLHTQSLHWALHANLPRMCVLFWSLSACLLLRASFPVSSCLLSLLSLLWLTFLPGLLGWPRPFSQSPVSIPSPYPALVPGHTNIYTLTSQPLRRGFFIYSFLSDWKPIKSLSFMHFHTVWLPVRLHTEKKVLVVWVPVCSTVAIFLKFSPALQQKSLVLLVLSWNKLIADGNLVIGL